jgi:thiol-disulfide isomerase/thioredoxin
MTEAESEARRKQCAAGISRFLGGMVPPVPHLAYGCRSRARLRRQIKVTKLNVDEAMNSAGRYNIRGIPTLLVFKNGQVVEQIVGAVPKDQITKAIDRHVG